MRFVIERDRIGAFRVTLRAEDDSVLLRTEGHTTRSAARRAIVAIRRIAPTARIEDQTGGA